jgi:hypothetical protein
MEYPKKPKKKSGKRIEGPFYPWLSEMGNSAAMAKLRKDSNAVNVLTMFISQFTQSNDGRNLELPYSAVKGIMSPAIFARSKLRACAFGFLYCREYGRLEHRASRYDLIMKWRHLSRQPEKLDSIEKLLQRRERIYRVPLSKIQSRYEMNPKQRHRMLLRAIEKRMLSL